jgi:hypothetical protein
MNKTDTFEKIMKQINKIPLWVKQWREINTLKLEVETLKNSIKEELYKEFMKKLGESADNERLCKENKMLRQQVKSLKEIIKEGR